VSNVFTQVLLAGQDGRIIAEVSPRIGPVSWRLNNVGKTTLTFSKRDPKLTAANLQLANRVLIQFDNGLPAWGGIIDLPSAWARDDYTATVYSGEQLLALRQTAISRVFTDATVGTIFENLVAESSDITQSGVDVGSVWIGEELFTRDYHYANVLAVIQNELIGGLSTADFYIEPSEVGGFIKFTANLYERRGSLKTGLMLIEGHNVSELRRTEQGPVVNSWDFAGADISGDSSSGWGDGRLTSNAIDLTSALAYGLRQGSSVQSSIKDQTSLNNVAATELSRTKEAWNGIEMKGVDRAPALFAGYDVGDRIPLEAYSYGFDGFEATVRVEGREFFPDTGQLGLLVSEDL